MLFIGQNTVQWGTYTLGDGTVLQFLRYRSRMRLVPPKTNNCFVYLQDIRDSLSDVIRTLEMISSSTGCEVWTYFYRGIGGSGGRFDIYGETTMLDTLDWLEHMLLSYTQRCMDLFLVSDRWSTLLSDVLFAHPALLNALTLQRYVVPVFLRVLPACPVNALRLEDVLEYFSFFDHVEIVSSARALYAQLTQTPVEATTQNRWLVAMRQDFPHLFVESSFERDPCFMQFSVGTMSLLDENISRRFPSTPGALQIVHITDDCQETYESHTRCRLSSFLAGVADEPITEKKEILLHVDACGATESIYYTKWKKRYSLYQKYSLDTETIVHTNGLLDRLLYTVLPRIVDTRVLVPGYIQHIPQECVISIPSGVLVTPRKIHGYPRLLLQIGTGAHTSCFTCTVFLYSDIHHLPQVLLDQKKISNLPTTQDLSLPYCNYTLFPSSKFVLVFKQAGIGRESLTVGSAEILVHLLVTSSQGSVGATS